MIYMACLRILGPRQLQEDVDDNGDMVAVRPGSREALADLWKANESKLDREIRDRFCLMPWTEFSSNTMLNIIYDTPC